MRSPSSPVQQPDQRSPALAHGQGADRPEDPRADGAWRGEEGTPATPPAPAGRASSCTIRVHQVMPAPALRAAWLNRILAPALAAARSGPCPVELRPTGLWAGWAAGDRSQNPDRRISITSRVVFMRPARIVNIYIHELAHELIDAAEFEIEGRQIAHSHDAAFFAVNLALLLRLDAVQFLTSERGSSWATNMSLYDLQDPPYCWEGSDHHEWIPRALTWALTQAHELAPTELTAETLAREVVERYWIWSREMKSEPARIALQKEASIHAAESRKTKISDLENDIFLFKSLAVVFGFLFMFLFCVNFR